MTSPLDQVVYGWSGTGLEGRNRLQLVATSESWREDDRYRRVALRLCRLEAPGDRDPTSFGWVDLGGRRFVFQRRMVASATGDARRLVAHVVAGPPRELPASLLLRAFRSGFWWDGDEIARVTPAARPEDLTIGWDASLVPQASAASHALMSRILGAGAGRPVAFEAGPAELHAALWGVCEAMPVLLDTIACSTYESGDMVKWFDVVGLDGRPRPRGVEWCPRGASEPRYDERQLGAIADLVGAAAAVRRASTEAGAPKTMRTVFQIAERAAAGHPEEAAPLLADESALASALASRSGTQVVARALWSAGRQRWPRLPEQSERVLALASATAAVASPDAQARCGVVVRRLQSISPQAGPAFVERLLSRRAKGESLPVPDHEFLAASLAWAYDTALPDEIVQALVSWVEENLTGALLADRRVPDGWREVLFQEASVDTRLDVDDYADLASRYPDLLDGATWLPDDRHLVDELITHPEPALRDRAARAAVVRWPAQDVVADALALADRGELSGALALLAALGEADTVLPAAQVGPLRGLLASLAEASIDGRLEIGLPELPWRVYRHLGTQSAWLDAVAATMLFAGGATAARAERWPAAVAALPASERPLASLVAVHDLTLVGGTQWTFQRIAARLPLAELAPGDAARVVYPAIERRAALTGTYDVAPLVLALADSVRRVGWFRRRVSVGEFEATARRLVAAALASHPAIFAAEREHLPRDVASWLKRSGALS